jgi:hypothetical protein
MSHFSQFVSKLNDLDSVKAACDELGLSIRANSTVKGYYSDSRSVKADFVISWPDCQYEVGLVRDAKTGHFTLVYDTWNGNVEKKLGKGCVKLIESANFHKIAKKAKLRGYSINRKDNEKGIQMTLMKYA